MSPKLQELWEELRGVLGGRTHTMDTLIPPLLYALVQALAGFIPAVISALALAALLLFYRLLRRDAWGYALSGFILVAVAVGFAWFSRSASSYFLPDLISSALLLLAALISILLGKPLAAWSSHLTRAWPREWYWLPQIRPAYVEVTWMWVFFIAARLAAQWELYRNASTFTLGWANALLGWPVTILVLLISYVYGIWRLGQLAGPSVEEFQHGTPPPWQGQKRGF